MQIEIRFGHDIYNIFPFNVKQQNFLDNFFLMKEQTEIFLMMHGLK